MCKADQYQLLDFGNGRKLERFGPFVLDRPSRAGQGKPRAELALWKTAHARYERIRGEQGVWLPAGALPARWSVVCESMTFEVKPNRFGHVGLFPEQVENWEWIARQVRGAGRPVKVLNLFAYTGGATMAAAGCGAAVVHVDAARNVVSWARRNAELSGLKQAPLRWIAEDARTFVSRELRRGSRYDAVILDPPSYGHGPKSEAWQIARDLGPLLKMCAELTQDARAFALLTCHSAGLGPAELSAALRETGLVNASAPVAAHPLHVRTVSGHALPAGAVARWPK